jgi:hypothetical protein
MKRTLKDLPLKPDLERAKKLLKPSSKKSHAEKFIEKAGRKNKPVEFFWLDRDPLTGEAI